VVPLASFSPDSSVTIEMAPLVSVIIPVYNGANYLHAAIESVLHQSFTDYELLVVDDGSTDETPFIIASYASRVRGYQKANGGVSSALNLGIRQARGRWIAWLSHDDLFLPEKLKKQIEFLRLRPRFRVCYTSVYIIDSEGRTIQEDDMLWYPPNKVIRALFRRTHINGSSILIDRGCFDEIGGFNEKLRFTQDVEMWIRLARHFEIGLLPERLVKSRFHLAQGSRNFEAMRMEEQETFGRLFQQLGASGVLPELAQSGHPAKAIAEGYEWFGDTMLVHHRWYEFAEEQYRHSIASWPSWRNPARLKRLLVDCRNLVIKEEPVVQRTVEYGRRLMGLGYHSEARRTFRGVLSSQPTRIDALGFWLITLLGRRTVLRLKKFRQWIRRSHRRFVVPS